MPNARVNEILLALSRDGHGGTVLPEALCRACAEALPVTGVGLALMTDEGHQGVIAATDGTARIMENLQFNLGEGPCLDATADGRPVLQPYLEHTGLRRWTGFGSEAVAAGIAAVFAFPLQVGRIRLGVLDLYRDTEGDLTDEELGEALAFADAATAVLLDLASRIPDAEDDALPPLPLPLQDRPEIHQATGMVAVQAALGLAEALALMRAHAYGSERQLLDVAKDVVARRLHFKSGEPSTEHL